MIIKFCGKCGTALRNDSVFCHHCGWKVLSAEVLKYINKSSSESAISSRKETENEIRHDKSSEEKEKEAEKVRNPKENFGQPPIAESRSVSGQKTPKDIGAQKTSLRKGLITGNIIAALLISAGFIGCFFLPIDKGWHTGLRISSASVATELNVRESLVLQGEKMVESDNIDRAAIVTDMAKVVFFSERDAKTGLCDIFIMDAGGNGISNIINDPAHYDGLPSF